MARQAPLAVCIGLALLACTAFAAPERLQGDCVAQDATQSGLSLFHQIQSSSMTLFPDHTKVSQLPSMYQTIVFLAVHSFRLRESPAPPDHASVGPPP